MAKHTFEYDDETRQISGPGYLVGEVWKLVATEVEAERARQLRFHDVYCAAIGRIRLGNVYIGDGSTTVDESKLKDAIEECHRIAYEQASRAYPKVTA